MTVVHIALIQLHYDLESLVAAEFALADFHKKLRLIQLYKKALEDHWAQFNWQKAKRRGWLTEEDCILFIEYLER